MTMPHRLGLAVRTGLGGLAILAICLALGALAWRPELRATVDATKTRAYSLSPQSLELLSRLEGDWQIAVVLASDQVDERMRRQVDEVLRRFGDSAPSLEIVSIDPTDPSTLPDYERLLAGLRAMEAPLIARHDVALDGGEALLDELLLYAQRVSASLEEAMGRLPNQDRDRERLTELAGLFEVMASQGGLLIDEIDRLRRPTDGRPLPDYDGATSTLKAVLDQWGDVVQDASRLFAGWARRADIDPALRAFAPGAAAEARDLAGRLVTAADDLTLPDLQIARVSRQLATGEAAVVSGPRGAAVIPSEALFPAIALDSAAGVATADRRFRGEQVISAAIRSLVVEAMPVVVFVHAEPGSLLQQRGDHADLIGVERALSASRIRAIEWNVTASDRPDVAPDEPVVWIVLPPSRVAGFEPDERERALLDTTRRLAQSGASLLLNLYPSLMPRYGMQDPWAAIAAELGVAADTERVILEATPLGADRYAVAADLGIDDASDAHPIGRAIDGQRLQMPLAVPLLAADAAEADQPDAANATDAADDARPRRDVRTPLARHDLVVATPMAGRWLESEWAQGALPSAPPAGAGLDAPVPLVVAVEHPHPEGTAGGIRGRQRAIVCASGGWMLSRTADAVADLGGGRVVLSHPANQELVLAATSWLAGQDDLIAPSAAGRQVPRLADIDGGVRARWALLVTLIAPIAMVLASTVTWTVRRRAA